ncbi:MAG TPA: RNA methyltransferase [Oligoflexia bacterium]|nr:RNA methyltransferase [Oligoflexia bacterium]HMP47454.1 RNA methyltransferase [Oligoflexia bacterium]
MNEEVRNNLLSMLTPERVKRIDNVLDNRTGSLTILLDRLFHPHNIAAILRTAEAFGLSKVYMIDEVGGVSSQGDPQRSQGISLGSERWIEVEKFSSANSAIDNLREKGFQFVCLQPPPIASLKNELVKGSGDIDSEKSSSDCCVSYMQVSELPFEKKLCLVFGSELGGLSPVLKDAASIFAHIPMYGFVESFNVSVACGITLFCSCLPKTKVNRQVQPLGLEEKLQLRDSWIINSVPRGESVRSYLEQKLTKEL